MKLFFLIFVSFTAQASVVFTCTKAGRFVPAASEQVCTASGGVWAPIRR